MIILVCGGRDYADKKFLYRKLDSATSKIQIDCIVHGSARGADTLAENWARDRQIDYRGFPAKWNRDGKYYAGPLRNMRMLNENKIDGVIAFNGGSGTANMIKIAKEKDIKVWDLRGGE